MFDFFFSSRARHTRYWRVWSSDVCSSDLHVGVEQEPRAGAGSALRDEERVARRERVDGSGVDGAQLAVGGLALVRHAERDQIGRASCRERVKISVGAVSLKKK